LPTATTQQSTPLSPKRYFFTRATAATETYTLSLHDALPICLRMFLLLITFLKASHSFRNRLLVICKNAYLFATMIMTSVSRMNRSEERFSRNAETDLVCRLLLEKKKKKTHTINPDNK